ncbi:hypothetical protein ABEB36_001230 [Hypothenemus hampei]|uniref:Major facilitator superfamily (MFS) profile domain-containing protein n=1 Tax=Hypothenemus hampei TaxID=57062 RepID=A0ABD1FDX4_HYPHA
MKFSNFRSVLGRRSCQFLAAITGSLGILASEMHFGWPSPALPVLTNGTYFIHVSSEEASWLAVTIFPGIACGALISNFLADRFGRKKIILATGVPLFVSWLILALARNDILLFLARFLGGVGGGLSFASVPMYLGEIAEPSIRGLLSSLCPVFVVMGILLINVLGIFLSIDLSAFLACVIPLIMFFTFIWMPESPIHLIATNRQEEARKNLIIFRGKEEGEKEYWRLSKDLEESMSDQKGPGGFRDLFKVKSNRKALLIALGLRSIQQMCGSTALTFYCKTIFQETESFISANTATILYFSLQAVLAIFASLVIDVFGRRPMFIFSLTGTTLTLFLMAVYLLLKMHLNMNLSGYTFVPVVCLLSNIAFFSMGVRNVPLLVISEIFHPKIKPVALCFVTIYYGILAIIVTKFYHFTSETVEMSCPIFIFGILSFASLIIYYLYVPETKGKTLEEIQNILKSS